MNINFDIMHRYFSKAFINLMSFFCKKSSTADTVVRSLNTRDRRIVVLLGIVKFARSTCLQANVSSFCLNILNRLLIILSFGE